MLIINFILGLLPIIWLVIALCGLKWPGYKAALGALIIAAVEALTYFGFSMSDTLTSILEEVKKRDYIDSHRDFAPLVKANDAIEIDTSNLTIDEVVDLVLKIINEKVGNINE